MKCSILKHDTIVKEYLPLVINEATHFAKAVPQSVQIDDLIQEGSKGLLDAIDKFDTARNVKFGIYARIRIRGAIYDYLRRLLKSRNIFNKQRRIDIFSQRYISEHNHPPSDDTIMQKVDITREQLYFSRNTANNGQLLTSQDYEIEPSVKDDYFPSELIEYMCKYLSRQNGQIIRLRYIKSYTLKKIGVMLQLSESRICQLHTEALQRIKEVIKSRPQLIAS